MKSIKKYIKKRKNITKFLRPISSNENININIITRTEENILICLCIILERRRGGEEGGRENIEYEWACMCEKCLTIYICFIYI